MNVDEKIHTLSDILFEVDPAGTCCKENDLFDEYDSFALYVISDVENGYNVENSIKENYEYLFSLPIPESKLNEVLSEIKKINLI